MVHALYVRLQGWLMKSIEETVEWLVKMMNLDMEVEIEVEGNLNLPEHLSATESPSEEH
jgi:hypothetical protein|tara:strand:+ start:595 stop:771 length:177 start_codon:yes stop_codon:yes gene_type:complete